MNSSCNVLNTTEMPVAEVVLSYPNALGILTKYNLDFCCGGKRPFNEACLKKGLNPEIIWDEIIHSKAVDIPFHLRLSSWSIPLLIEYIIQNHHNYVREATVKLGELLDKVCSVHGGDHVELMEIREDFTYLAEELYNHMNKEEKVLFPAFIQSIKDNNSGYSFSYPNMESPIRAMEDEHESAGDLIKSIRQLSNLYSVPPNACTTFKLTYKMLEEFDQDLMQHIHVENNVLFERVRSN